MQRQMESSVMILEGLLGILNDMRCGCSWILLCLIALQSTLLFLPFSVLQKTLSLRLSG